MRRSDWGWLAAAVVGAVAASATGAGTPDILSSYKGTPYEDSRYHDGAQKIPGKVYCAYYDRGGEGVAYHDADAKNNGSGASVRIINSL